MLLVGETEVAEVAGVLGFVVVVVGGVDVLVAGVVAGAVGLVVFEPHRNHLSIFGWLPLKLNGARRSFHGAFLSSFLPGA
ncbi:hypothetical protein RAM_41145 [Amycolatopsis mediterranei S699]|uniref:Uncharacterized protein n=1 Tax=Amycolatopsis mediterranei (strain S699) TaxID=713604 RepID=A0A9R0P5I2_AMYMS|nr:hypothetical protein RAM_41145 [Amycolatopsis mediterranei S699]